MSDLLKTAKKRALYLLGGRDYSKVELYKKLAANYPGEICGEVIDWVAELGYIDDFKYGANLAAKYLHKGYGEHKIRYELKMRGIESDIIDTLVCGIESEDFRSEITTLLKKKYRDKLSDRNETQKVISALARRGYDYDDIKSCINALSENVDFD